MKISSRQRATIRLIVLFIFLFFGLIFWLQTMQNGRIQVAVAKGTQMLNMGTVADRLLSPEQLLTTIPELAAIQQNENILFVEAVKLGQSEGQQWVCGNDCAHAVYYDLDKGETINAIVDLQAQTIEAQWTDALARPAGTQYILPRTLEIAAADPQVQAILGDIGAANPAMTPMSGWLADDDCALEWCVDLTFASPAQDGRIFHIFVNLEQGKVARTFYTRGRPDLDVQMPVRQRGAFEDGCQEQTGWSVCWEMTAHDGLNFTDATFEDTLLFSSAKITQIEAWYPSWPGGYRDEIGFNATVRPYGSTEVNELEDGFEVRQLFSEFTRWPNCVCCYRYEQIIQFHADGSLDFRFTSHGPGCDDLSIYKPFWRIDVDMAEPDENDVRIWNGTRWVKAETEQELHPFVETPQLEGSQLGENNGNDLAATGNKVTISHDDNRYQWQMVRTDPRGQDEAYFFILQDNPDEGEGPLLPGPGNSYQPPRQWLNDDPASGEDVVFWFVPLLKTKKSEPWWCMPDPEPGINQCEAILHAEPIHVQTQPDEEVVLPTPIPENTPTPTTIAIATTTPAPTATPRPLEGETVEEVILNAGCGSCHVIGELGEARKVGPDLTHMKDVAAERIDGVTADDYLRQSILNPNAFIVRDCPNGPCLAGAMPQDYANRLSPIQIELIVTFLLSANSEPALESDNENNTIEPLPKSNLTTKETQQPTQPLSTIASLSLLLLLMLFVMGLFMIWKRPSGKS